MTIRIMLFTTAMCCAAAICAQGVDDRAKDKAEQKTNARIDTRIDQGLDKGLNSIEGLFKKKKKKNSSPAEQEPTSPQSDTDLDQKNDSQAPVDGAPDGMFGTMFTPASWEDTYDFGLSITSLITTTKNNGKAEENQMEVLFGQSALSIRFVDEKKEEESPLIVFDKGNHSFITLMEDKKKAEKSGVALAMNQNQIDAMVKAQAKEATTTQANFTKTGKSKEILGYNCYEYVFSDDVQSGSMWMTDELDVSMLEIAGFIGSSKSKSTSVLPENYPQGYAMEMRSFDEKKKEAHHYMVTAVDENLDLTIDTRVYNVTDPMQMMNSGKH